MMSTKIKMLLYNHLGFLTRNRTMRQILRKVFIKNFGCVDSLAVHINSKCNLSCVYCSEQNRQGKEINLNEFYRLVDEAKISGITQITLAGGEPFLHKDIFNMLSYCQSKGLKSSVYTNGTLIGGAEVKNLQRIKGLKLVFKFDSPLSYKEHVGSDIYKEVTDTIQVCTGKGIISVARVNVTKKNLKHLSAILNNVFDLGAEPVIERHVPLKNDGMNKQLELSPEEWQAARKAYNKCCANHLSQSIKEFEAYKSNQARLLGYKCFGFNSTIVIRPNGNAVPCGLAPDELSVGNINKEPLSAVLKRYYEQRKVWNKIPEECRKCKNADTCRGGCKAYAYIKLRCFDKKDPLCKNTNP